MTDSPINTSPRRKSSRRLLLAGVPAIAAMAAIPALSPNPDAALIELCGKIDALEAEFIAPDTDYELDSNREYRDLRTRTIVLRQDVLIKRMCAMQATSAQGHQARARTIVKWAPDLTTNAACLEESLIGALLRDLVAGGAA